MNKKPTLRFFNRTKTSTGVALLMVLVVSCQKQLGDQQQIQNPNAFDIDKFEANIKNTYGPKTVGFSYAIAVGENIVRHGAMGMASMGSADGISGYASETRQELFSVTQQQYWPTFIPGLPTLC